MNSKLSWPDRSFTAATTWNHPWPRTLCPPEPSSVVGKCTEACHLNPSRPAKRDNQKRLRNTSHSLHAAQVDCGVGAGNPDSLRFHRGTSHELLLTLVLFRRCHCEVLRCFGTFLHGSFPMIQGLSPHGHELLLLPHNLQQEPHRPIESHTRTQQQPEPLWLFPLTRNPCASSCVSSRVSSFEPPEQILTRA